MDSGGIGRSRTKFKRVKGWHHLEIEVSKRGAICLIDSKIAFASGVTYKFNAAGLEMVGAKAKHASSYYFDDFAIDDGAQKAPVAPPAPSASAAKTAPVVTLPVLSTNVAVAAVVSSSVVAAVASSQTRIVTAAGQVTTVHITLILSILAACLLFIFLSLVRNRKLMVGTFGIIKRRREQNPCYGVSQEEHIEKLEKLLKARSSWEISENFIHGSTVILSVNTRVLVVKKHGALRHVRILKGKREGQAFWVHKSYIKRVK
jgi:hypothetical protein